jgi:hypothetical protein
VHGQWNPSSLPKWRHELRLDHAYMIFERHNLWETHVGRWVTETDALASLRRNPSAQLWRLWGLMAQTWCTITRASAGEWSDIQIGYSTRLTLSAGVSSSGSFTTDRAIQESGGIWEGHQYDLKNSDTLCHVYLPMSGWARSTLFQRMCAPLRETRKLVGQWL